MCGGIDEDVSEINKRRITMVFNLKCKCCNQEQTVTIEEIESNKLYRCKYCDNTISMADTTRLSNLLELESFEMPNTYNFAGKNDVFSVEFALETLKKNYYNCSDDNRDKILLLMDHLNLIISNKDSEQIHNLCKIVDEYYKETVRKKHEEISKMLGIDDDEIL